MKSYLHRAQPEFGVLVGLFLIPLLFFAPVSLGGRTLIPADNLYQYEPWAAPRDTQGVPEIPHNALLSDLVLQNYQWKLFLRDNLREGEIPLWQPNQFSGTPFLANGQHSALYPFSLIYYVLPLESAFGWFTVSQLWIAGLCLYLYLRGMGLSRGAGWAAAVAYQLSSFFIVATVHPMIQAAAAWLPLILLMIEFIIRQQTCFGKPTRLVWVLVGAGALGMSFLAGHIEITYYTLLVSGFYAAGRLIIHLWQSGRTALLTQAAALLMMVGLGFGIGAIQFIPLLETASDSFRTERSSLAEVRGYALPPRHILLWLMPNVYGNPAHHEIFDLFAWESTPHDWQLVEGDHQTRITNTDFGIKNYVEGGVSVGILTLVLAALGLITGRRNPHIWLLAILGIVAALFMFGTPFYALLYYALPGLNQLHTPFRWAWPFTFVLCVLAAYGVEAIRTQSALWIRRLGWGITITGASVLIGLGMSRIFYESQYSLIERIFTGLAGANRAFPNAESFYHYQSLNVAILGGLLISVGLLIARHRMRYWPLFAALIIGLDAFLATGNFNTAAKTEWLDYTPPAIAWLVEQQQASLDSGAGPFRIQAFDWGENPIVANAGWRYGLHDVRGYDSLFSKQYADYMGRIAPQDGLAFNRIDPIRYNNPQTLLSPELDRLNVRFFVTDWIIRPEEEFGVSDLSEVGLALVYEDTAVRIYENLDALPRAYTLPDTENFGDFAPATITRYQDTNVYTEVVLDAPRWLVLADTYTSGWRAFLRPIDGNPKDEREIPVSRIDGNLRGVWLEAGAWAVRWDYSPQSFQLGGFTSFISGMLTIFLLLLWLWQTFVGEKADADSGRRVIKNSLAPIALNLFNRGIDFAFAFIMLRILEPEGAGIYYYAVVIFGWFDILTNFGLNTLLTREVARDRSTARSMLLNTTILRLGLAVVGVPVLIGFLVVRNATVSPALDHSALLAIGLLYLGLIPNSLSTGLSALFYAFEKAEYPAALATVSTLIKVSLGLGALLMGWGVVGLAGVSIITNLATLLMMTRLAWPLIPAGKQALIAWGGLRGMIGESWPLMLNHLLATIFFKIDVVLMEAINGVVIVGIYSTAYKWLDALNIIPAFFTMALLPLMARQALEDKAALRRNYILGFKALSFVSLPLAVFTTFAAPALIGFLGGAEYLPEGGIALQIMIWSILVGWINSLTQYVLIALNRQRQITFAFVAAVTFNIVANLIFLPEYSYRAAAITTIMSEAALLVGFYWLLRKDLGDISYIGVLWRPVLAAGVMLGMIGLVWGISPTLAVFAGIGVYPIILGLLRPLEPEEAARLLPAPARRFVVRKEV